MSEYGNPPGQPQYGGSHDQPAPKKGKGLAIAALVLGVLALLTSITVVGGILFGLIAVVLGFVASGKAKRGQAGGRGLAIGGIVTGVLGIVIAGALIALGAAFFSSDTAQDLQSCVDDAGGDQQAIDDCEQQLEDNLGG